MGQSDSFEGWFFEIKRLHRLCPWTSKQPMDKIIASSLDLQYRRYRSMLQSLDQQFLRSGMKVVPESSRSPSVATLPLFFDDQADKFAYVCKECKSFISLLDSTVGRGTMGQQSLAFILHPKSAIPFSCGICEEAEIRLSSGSYILRDLVCPNSECDASLGWKYED